MRFLFTWLPISCFPDSDFFFPGIHIKAQENDTTYMSSCLPSRVAQTCIPMGARQPLSHLPSQYKANLIFPQGPWDDASLLQAFCRLNTASLEWIRRFRESNYQLANPEAGANTQHEQQHPRRSGVQLCRTLYERSMACCWRWWVEGHCYPHLIQWHILETCVQNMSWRCCRPI